jgi:aspartokinase
MLAYAERGASVLNDDAVATAAELGVPLHARATFADAGGTLVTSEVSAAPLVGVAMRREVHRVRGRSDAVDALVAAPHRVQRREIANGAHEALLVLSEGTSPEALEGVSTKGPFATVSLVGRRAPSLDAAIDAAIEGAGVEAHERWTDAVSSTRLLARGDVLAACRALHAALLERRALGAASEQVSR